MNVQYLRYAVEIARIGSVNKAAEELFVAQPNLSRAIKELEKDLNIVIFDRNAKGMTLTPDGERLVFYGKKILKEIEEAESALKNHNVIKKKFSAAVPRAEYIIEAFSAFGSALKREETAEFILKETDTAHALKCVAEEDYDLGIIRYEYRHDAFYKKSAENNGLECELVSEFRYGLLMNKNCPLAETDGIKNSDLQDFIEISRGDPYISARTLNFAEKNTVRRKICLFGNDCELKILSKNAETFIWSPPVSKEVLDRYGLVFKYCSDNGEIYRDVLVRRKDRPLSSLGLQFITELCSACRKINR